MGWSGVAMVLGNIPVPGHLTNLDDSRTRPTMLTVGGMRVVWAFSSCLLSDFYLCLGDGPVLSERAFKLKATNQPKIDSFIPTRLQSCCAGETIKGARVLCNRHIKLL